MCEAQHFVRFHARFRRFVVNIDLQADIQVGKLVGALCAEALGDLEAIDGMDPVEMGGDSPGFIGLQVPDKVPDKVISAAGGDLFEPFLDEIFAKVPLTGIGSLKNGRNRLFFADCE